MILSDTVKMKEYQEVLFSRTGHKLCYKLVPISAQVLSHLLQVYLEVTETRPLNSFISLPIDAVI